MTKQQYKNFHTNISGVTYENPDRTSRQEIIRRFCKPGMPVVLIREPYNQYGDQTVGVWLNKLVNKRIMQIGYIKSEIAEEIADQIDRGLVVLAEIEEVTGGTKDKPTFGVNLIVHFANIVRTK